MKAAVGMGVRVAFAIGVLAILFQFVSARDVLAAVATLHPGYLVAGLLLQFVVRAVTAVRAKLVADAQGFVISIAAHWRILLAAQFYSMLLPGPVAGGGATWLKYLQHGADRNAAAVTILLSRAIGLLVMIIVGATAWVIDAQRSNVGPLAAAAVAVALLALAGSAARWAPVPHAPSAAARWPVRILGELRRRLLLLADMRIADKALVLAASVAHELVGAAVMWSFAMAAGLDLTLVTVLWIRAALQLVLLLPVTIAGLGLREAGLIGLGALIGVPAHTAMTWSLTIFAGTLVIAAAGGMIEAAGMSGHVLRRFPDRTRAPEAGPMDLQ